MYSITYFDKFGGLTSVLIKARSEADADQNIQVECNHKTIFKGKPDDFEEGLIFERMQIKCVWYSQLFNAILIEI